jgi:hypothetical protein
MSNTKELDMLTDQAGCDLPEVFYGKNKLIAVMPSKDLMIEICPVDAVSLTSFQKREAYLRPSADRRECTNAQDHKILNLVDMIPSTLEVKQAEHWKKKDTTKIKDFTKIEIVSDWTYSTAYKGTYSFASSRLESLKNTTGLIVASTA